MSDKEAFYDRCIAPRLMEMARECESQGIAFLALVEWAPGETGRTCAMPPEAGVGFRMAEMAARARGNADALISGIMRYGEQHGHNSVCLFRLGVPTKPEAGKGGAP